MIKLLNELYNGDSHRAIKFRAGLFVFDFFILAYICVSSFHYGHETVELGDKIIGSIVVIDFLARLLIAKSKGKFLISLDGVVDIVTIASLLLPLVGESFAFLRVLRIFRLYRSPAVLEWSRKRSRFFRKHEDVVISALNLFLFIFIMTALVFESQIGKNEKINNYVDALYFTVSTLTTTGFGDIVLLGHDGKLMAIIVMICGVSLFLRLIQTVFRPNKVRFPCPACGLLLHDRDAVHCKHCGLTLAIPDEGHI